MSTSTKVVQELVHTACSAPSVHNTQPWAWRIPGPDTVELLTDPVRLLPHLDPRGRELVISCGAALHHLVVAAGAFGLSAEPTLLPDPDDERLLARVALTRTPVRMDAVDLLSTLEDRVTDRSGFTSWPVPPERLRHLAEVAAEWGAHAHVLDDPRDLHRAEVLIDRARATQLGELAARSEQDSWLEHGYGATDGVPPDRATPESRPGTATRSSRFAPYAATRAPGELLEDHPDGLVVLFTGEDDRPAWLRTGMALSALWLEATRLGLSVIPESQLTEVDETREQLRHGVFDGMGWPQLLLRVGFQEATRPRPPRTPRRPVEDVIVR